MPLPAMKDNEVFAPRYEDGEQVALIRYPHGGLFEIPILTVNNKHPEARKTFGTTPADVVGINSKVASILSGADFDGDTVMVIPTGNKVHISHRPPLEGLKNFDPKSEYGHDRVEKDPVTGKERYFRNGKEIKVMKNTQTEMGVISNLITDMTLLGAKNEEIERAVKHSMVIIDAEKHKLDYKSSYTDNNIAALKKRYQGKVEDGKYREGATTLISKSKSQKEVIKTKGTPKINDPSKQWYDPTKPEGALIWQRPVVEYKVYKYVKDPLTGKKKIDPETGKPIRIDTGKTSIRTQTSTKMAFILFAYSAYASS
jgi:hypothetical protein